MMMMMMENIHISTDIRRGACFALYQIPLFLSHRYSCMLTPINDDDDGDGGDKDGDEDGDDGDDGDDDDDDKITGK